MHQSVIYPAEKKELYPLLALQLEALISSCSRPLPALCNCAALLWEALPDINWAGFYLLRDETLYLGPFQGKIACTVIPVGRGVCGTAAEEKRIQLVPDVHAFPGHIACDSASNSEIVLPVIAGDKLVGVMDIDSPLLNRFTQEDSDGLAALCRILCEQLNWTEGLL